MPHRRSISILVCTLAFAAAAAAHHSHGNYQQYFVDLEGTVTDVQLINPHSWIYLDVKGQNGEAVSWALEATGTGGLTRLGIVRGYVKPGDTIKSAAAPEMDGGCLLGFVQPRWFHQVGTADRLCPWMTGSSTSKSGIFTLRRMTDGLCGSARRSIFIREVALDPQVPDHLVPAHARLAMVAEPPSRSTFGSRRPLPASCADGGLNK
jgi:hypothetical protein